MKKILIFQALVFFLFSACQTNRVQTNPQEFFAYNKEGGGTEVEVEFSKGPAHNHPLMAIWIEDSEGTFIQTLYVSESIGKGIFAHADKSKGKWMPGEIRRPSALPVWSHRRGIPASDGLYTPDPSNPVADAYTGPTPSGNFIMRFRTDQAIDRFILFFEINQSWDWNEYWTNDKYPGDEDYMTSCQPSLIYSAFIDTSSPIDSLPLEIMGHGHFSGDDGLIYKDLSSITTAKNIAENIFVRF